MHGFFNIGAVEVDLVETGVEILEIGGVSQGIGWEGTLSDDFVDVETGVGSICCIID